MRTLILGLLFFALAGHAQPKQVINILFVGKTQTGKSSLINISYNHIGGKRYEDGRAFVIPLLDGANELLVNVDPYQSYGVELRKPSESQTSDVLRYTVENDQFIVHLWDTPGFNDTNQQVSDEEIARKIAVAIGETSFNMIAFVLRPNEPATFDMKANIDRIRVMLPKSAAKNIAGIYTRAANFSTGMKNANAQMFAQLLGINQLDIVPRVYNIDGSSFFDIDAFDGHSRWKSDGKVVNKFLFDAAQLDPFDAQAVIQIQSIMNDMQAKKLQRNALVKHFNEENRGLGIVWQNNCRAAKGFPSQNKWFTPKTQSSFYFQAADVQRDNERIVVSTNQNEVFEFPGTDLLLEIRDLKVAWSELALSTDVSSFIVYLEHQIRSAERQSSCDETSRKNRIDLLNSQKNFYTFIRDL